ncbi:hypothetical protein, partial [Enterococcus faecium]
KSISSLMSDPRQRVSRNLDDFFLNIAAADLFFVFNQDRKGVLGYIGAATFSEMKYCLMQNLIHGKRIKIVLFKEPSEENFLF